MKMLNVKGLCKRYGRFSLDHVSFSLDKGYIMGFIGCNGAGKTTTLKGIMNMIHTDGGQVEFFGSRTLKNDLDLKQDIAFMLGGSDYYRKRKLKTVARAVKRFYSRWDEQAYRGYLKRFKLDEEKRIDELSQGMAVKFSLCLALSHNARLLILDEPTSGLDPAARDSLLELFQELVESGERSILFSTHITSDLEKCADLITFIHQGEIIKSCPKDELIQSYRLVSGSEDELAGISGNLIAYKKNSFGFQGLMEVSGSSSTAAAGEAPSLDDIMVYYTKREEERYDESAL